MALKPELCNLIFFFFNSYCYRCHVLFLLSSLTIFENSCAFVNSLLFSVLLQNNVRPVLLCDALSNPLSSPKSDRRPGRRALPSALRTGLPRIPTSTPRRLEAEGRIPQARQAKPSGIRPRASQWPTPPVPRPVARYNAVSVPRGTANGEQPGATRTERTESAVSRYVLPAARFPGQQKALCTGDRPPARPLVGHS